MEKLITFGILSIPIIILSWKSLMNIKSHGFYRFFAWEGILWLLLSNYKFWFNNPFSIQQLLSWFLLFFAAYLVFAGIIQFRIKGNAQKARDDKSLYQFEKTTELVDTGIFKFIRHPMYSSLIFLTWGILFKHITFSLILVSVASTLFLLLTTLKDEKECVAYFGDKYREYMKRTKRFVPFVI